MVLVGVASVLLFLSSFTSGSPILRREEAVVSPDVTPAPPLALVPQTSPASFNYYNGLDSMATFDDFFGVDNFDGSNNVQTVVVQEQSVVCVAQEVRIIQQQLVILQEMAKRIITQQICQVEVQTIVLQQFQSGLTSFSLDIQRETQKVVGFDENIANLAAQLLNEDLSLNAVDFGFNGVDVGAATVVVNDGSGDDDQVKNEKAARAKQAAKAASKADELEKQKEEELEAQEAEAAQQAAEEAAAQQQEEEAAATATEEAPQAEETAQEEAAPQEAAPEEEVNEGEVVDNQEGEQANEQEAQSSYVAAVVQPAETVAATM